MLLEEILDPFTLLAERFPPPRADASEQKAEIYKDQHDLEDDDAELFGGVSAQAELLERLLRRGDGEADRSPVREDVDPVRDAADGLVVALHHTAHRNRTRQLRLVGCRIDMA